MGPRNVEIPESRANSERRHVNLANVAGAMTGEESTGKRNVLASSIQDLTDEDSVASLG